MKGLSLHIGLNYVDADAYGGWDGELAGCENDAADMRAVAERLGYQPASLITAAATAANVIAHIHSAAAAMEPSDVFLLTFSGHGGQVPDRNRDEASLDPMEVGEFPDRWDETWVLHDRQLVDDELWALWELFPPKSRVVVVSDSCHSGTVTRLVPPAGLLGAPPRRMPLRVEDRDYEARREVYDEIQDQTPGRDAADGRLASTVVLLSGCQDNQFSYDGPVNGAFTGAFLQVWDQGRFVGSLSRLVKAVRSRMPPEQTPNYYSTGHRNSWFLSRQALRI
jgi:hypothetical protein